MLEEIGNGILLGLVMVDTYFVFLVVIKVLAMIFYPELVQT